MGEKLYITSSDRGLNHYSLLTNCKSLACKKEVVLFPEQTLEDILPARTQDKRAVDLENYHGF